MTNALNGANQISDGRRVHAAGLFATAETGKSTGLAEISIKLRIMFYRPLNHCLV
jgi:hypothetical protein